MSLISYVKTVTNKRLLISKSRSDSNQCTSCMGNLINTTRTLHMPVHVCHAYASYGRFSYMVTFHADPTKLDGWTAPEKKVLLTPPLSQTEWSVRPASVSVPNTTIETVCLSQISVDEYATLVYWIHITSK
jgi:hypothetical protein